MTQQEKSKHIVTAQEYGAYAGGEEERALTHEMIEEARKHIGEELPSTRENWWTAASYDAIRHWSTGIGDDNPLYSDLAYAKKTRWGNLIASPHFNTVLGVPDGKKWSPQELARLHDPLSGIHAWQAGGTTYYYRPIYLGDTLTHRRWRGDYVEKRSQFSGITVLDYGDSEARNQKGELVVASNTYSIRGGRQRKWGERSKYADLQPQHYTAEDMARIDAVYAKEKPRGAEKRYWEDVQVGEEMPTMVKGPLTVSDMILYKMGGFTGMLASAGSARVAYKQRTRHPRGFLLNEYGFPDCLEAVHWDNGFAQRTGNPLAYDLGSQRMAWLIHYVTDWIGDDGWLRMFYEETRTFVYVGDTLWCRGHVTGKRFEDGECIVDLEFRMEDQRGRVTEPGRAEVMLPSRRHGPVKLPPKFKGRPGNWKGPAVD